MKRPHKWASIKGLGPGHGMSWHEAAYVRPSPAKVAQLEMTHGFAACCERWGYIPEDSLRKMASEGKRELEAA